jgi:hypothetical protein
MATPHFWAQRVADDDWRPLSDFASETDSTGGSATSPASGLSVSFSDLDPGDYVIAVSKEQSGLKSSTQAAIKKDVLGRSTLSPALNAKIGFSESNPAVEARASGTLSDYAASEVEDSVLTTDANGGDATVATLYDQGGGTDLTAPSQSEEPAVVTGGTLVTDADGNPALETTSGTLLSGNLTAGPVTLGVVADASDQTDDIAYGNGLSLSMDASGVEAHVNGPGIDFSRRTVPNTSQTTPFHFTSSGTLYLYVLSNLDGEHEVYEWTGSSWTQIEADTSGPTTGAEYFVEYDGTLFLALSSDGLDYFEIWSWSPSAGFTKEIDTAGSVQAAYTYGGALYYHDGFDEVHEYDGSGWTTTASGQSRSLLGIGVEYQGRAFVADASGDVLSWAPLDTNSWVVEKQSVDPTALATYDGNLYTLTYNDNNTPVRKYDGSTWSMVSTPFSGIDGTSLTTHNSKLWVTHDGTTTLWSYDGSAWTGYSNALSTVSGTTYEPVILGVSFNGRLRYTFRGSSEQLYDGGFNFTERSRKTTVSLPRSTDPTVALATLDGSGVTLRAEGNEASASYSHDRTNQGAVDVASAPGRLSRAVAFEEALTTGKRVLTEAVLNNTAPDPALELHLPLAGDATAAVGPDGEILNGSLNARTGPTGAPDGSLYFPDSNNVVVKGQPGTKPNEKNEVTIAFWIYYEKLLSFGINWGNFTAYDFWVETYRSDSIGNSIFMPFESGGKQVESDDFVSLASWAFAAYTFDGSTISITTNGNRYTESRSGQLNFPSTHFIGGRNGGTSDIDARIADARVYSRALTESEITFLYNNPFAYLS